MYNTLFSVALFAVTAVSGVLAGFAINTPKFTQCQPATISWAPGVGPYHLYVIEPNNPCGDPILDLGEFKETSISWTVQIPTDAKVQLYVEDSGTNDAWSGVIHTLASDDQTCLPASVRHYYKIPDAKSTPTPSPSPGATLVVPQNFPTQSPPVIVPVGAANAGTNPLAQNAAFPARRVCGSLATFGAFIVAVILAL